MKCLVLLSVTIAASAASVLNDPVYGYKEGDRYFYFPGDGDNTLHLVDAEESVDLEFIQKFTSDTTNYKYMLYTRTNPSTAQEIVFGDSTSLTGTNYDFSKVTVFTSHGWRGDGENTMNQLLVQAFLEDDNVNVIVLDWSALAGKSYTTAKGGTAAVGKALGQFVIWLVGLGLSYDRVHLVGFSLGGHLVGNAGREASGKIKRITALDPAGPLWSNDDERIVSSDARYVEVIHTDTNFLGYTNPCGHADFYPNGGGSQPGCWLSYCSHSRSYQLMASTVKNKHLFANECNSHSEATSDTCTGTLYAMGTSDLTKSRMGIFRVNTEGEYPY